MLLIIFSVLEDLDISNLDDTWVQIRDSIKTSAEGKIGILQTHPGSFKNAQN